MKDNFSTQSDLYLKYRPDYPDSFFNYLEKIQTGNENAWDCGTGNGQVAKKLAGFHKNVYASDISQAQLGNALQLKNIHYAVQPAEKTDYPDNFFDLITVAQAIHWFDFGKFYSEVNRTAKNNALLAVIGYGRIEISPDIDELINYFYKDIVGSYWDKERKYIDENYRTIPFPFEKLSVPEFNNYYLWTFEHLIGYLGTWSAVKHFIKDKGNDPVKLIYPELKEQWGEIEKRTVNFPLLLRIGRINK